MTGSTNTANQTLCTHAVELLVLWICCVHIVCESLWRVYDKAQAGQHLRDATQGPQGVPILKGIPVIHAEGQPL